MSLALFMTIIRNHGRPRLPTLILWHLPMLDNRIMPRLHTLLLWHLPRLANRIMPRLPTLLLWHLPTLLLWHLPRLANRITPSSTINVNLAMIATKDKPSSTKITTTRTMPSKITTMILTRVMARALTTRIPANNNNSLPIAQLRWNNK